MPITGRTPEECFDTFKGHLGALIAATVTTRPLIGLRDRERPERMTLGFREQGPVTVPIETRFGRLYFYLGQALEVVPDGDEYRLCTRQYWYRVQAVADFKGPAIVRWEYDHGTEQDRHCRHHAHLPVDLDVGDGKLDLSKAHLPTGWVTIEEVIRFLIVELGVDPICGPEAWGELLIESERRFYEDFTGKRYNRPAS